MLQILERFNFVNVTIIIQSVFLIFSYQCVLELNPKLYLLLGALNKIILLRISFFLSNEIDTYMSILNKCLK